MTIWKLDITRLSARLTLAAVALAGCSLLMLFVLSRFVIGTLADDRVEATRDILKTPLEYFPGSARLNARLAAAELSESDRDLAGAELHAKRAIDLSPNDYRFRLTLASIKEAAGDRAAAEQSLEAARDLAPHYWSIHYRLGNLLVRQGKLAGSLDEFRVAVASNIELLPGTLDLVWRASGGDVDAVGAVCGNAPKAKLALAQFLLRESRPAEAGGVFGGIDRGDRLASPTESSAFLTSLIAAGKLDLARNLWSDLAGSDRQSSLIWNGGFEAELSKTFPQFDWTFNRSEFARLSIDSGIAHGGSRSLKVEFAGRDTTQLDNEIKQLVPVRPGARYKLECFVRTSGLEAPEGPRIVVAEVASQNWIGASSPIASGSNEWQRVEVEFVAPQAASGNGSAVVVSIKRKPKFSYDEPTRGIVWFDDFSMNEQ